MSDKFEYIALAGFGSYETEIFSGRLCGGKVKSRRKYEDFLQEENLISTVNLLKLDPEKFWTLSLFLYDYCFDACFNGVEYVEGGHHIMWKLIDRGRQLVAGGNPEPLQADASCTFRLQHRNYKVKDPNAIAILLYWIHRGMIQASPTDPIWELNWLIDDYDIHAYDRQQSTSVAIWMFASLMLDFFKQNKQFFGHAPKGSEVSMNKKLLISRLVHLLDLSQNENFLYSDETLNGFLKQYRNKPLPDPGKVYSRRGY